MSKAALPDALLDVLRRTDSATVANAVEELKLRPRLEGFLSGLIRAQFPDLGPMVGRALTVTMTDGRGADPDRAKYWQLWTTLEAFAEPTVIVMADASGHPDRVAYAGEIMCTMAQRLGAVGIVSDGALRDLAEVRALGFHYFTPFAVASHGDFEVASVGEPVVIGGQEVRTGDLLHGDANGVVIVPEGALETIGPAVAALQERESGLLEFIRSDEFTVSGLRERLSASAPY